jgi:predicted PurR-regulated permease PerM
MAPESNGTDPEPTVSIAPRTTALTVIAAVAAIYLLKFAQPVLIPIVVAILISFALTPLVNLLTRILYRTLASALAIVLFSGAIGFAVWAVTDDAIRVVQSMPEAARRVRGMVREQRRSADGPLKQMQQAATEIERTANEAAPPAARAAGDVQRVQIVEPAFRASDYLWLGGMGAVGAVSQLAVVLFLAYFLLASGDLYKRKMVKIAGPTLSKRRVTVQILDAISSQIARFMLTLLGTSLIVAAATATALWWLELEGWLFWGMAAGILNTIPYFGPVIVSTALTVVGFIQFGTIGRTLAVTGAAFAITSLEGWLITPALMGRAASMNPAAVFVGLLFWGWVWGIWGVVLAVPMMMLVKSVCDHIEDLNGVGELLGD